MWRRPARSSELLPVKPGAVSSAPAVSEREAGCGVSGAGVASGGGVLEAAVAGTAGFGGSVGAVDVVEAVAVAAGLGSGGWDSGVDRGPMKSARAGACGAAGFAAAGVGEAVVASEGAAPDTGALAATAGVGAVSVRIVAASDFSGTFPTGISLMPAMAARTAATNARR